MKFGKKVVVAVDLAGTSKEQLKMLRHLDFLKTAEVHFTHVYQTTVFGYGFGEAALIYPVESDRKLIEQSALASLVSLTQDIMPTGSETKIIQRCLFDDNPKEEFCLYAQEVKADTIVVLSREKHGLFDSSFAQYVNKHSRCHVLILKPNVGGNK